MSDIELGITFNLSMDIAVSSGVGRIQLGTFIEKRSKSSYPWSSLHTIFVNIGNCELHIIENGVFFFITLYFSVAYVKVTVSPEKSSHSNCESPVAFSSSDFNSFVRMSYISDDTIYPCSFSAKYFVKPEDDIFLILKLFSSLSLIIFWIGSFTVLSIACIFPELGVHQKSCRNLEECCVSICLPNFVEI